MKRLGHLYGIVVLVLVLAAGVYEGLKESQAAPQPVPPTILKTGGTAVLFTNGLMFDLTLGGWKEAPDIPIAAESVQVVLSSKHLVSVTNEGWVYVEGKWKKFPPPFTSKSPR